MKGHVSAESLVDVAEGSGMAAEREHVLACRECRLEVEQLRAQLSALREVEVPEPSPLYWEAFRRQVGSRLEAEPQRSSWRAMLVPAFALGALLVVAIARWPQGSGTLPQASVPAWSALPGEQGEGLLVLQALAEGGQLGSFAGCADTADCVASLDDDGARALSAALRSELPQGDL